jgi:hypothetical protein
MSACLNLLEPSGPVQACNGIAVLLEISGRSMAETSSVLKTLLFFSFTVIRQPIPDLGRLIVKVYRSETIRNTHTHLIGLP